MFQKYVLQRVLRTMRKNYVPLSAVKKICEVLNKFNTIFTLLFARVYDQSVSTSFYGLPRHTKSTPPAVRYPNSPQHCLKSRRPLSKQNLECLVSGKMKHHTNHESFPMRSGLELIIVADLKMIKIENMRLCCTISTQSCPLWNASESLQYTLNSGLFSKS